MWVKLDDAMPDDPDVDSLSDGAFRLYVAGICYCGRYLTDGYIDADRIPRLVRRYRAAYVTELLNRGLWLDHLPGGYIVRNFTKWNKTREHWKKEAEKAAVRKATWAAKRDQENAV